MSDIQALKKGAASLEDETCREHAEEENNQIFLTSKMIMKIEPKIFKACLEINPC